MIKTYIEYRNVCSSNCRWVVLYIVNVFREFSRSKVDYVLERRQLKIQIGIGNIKMENAKSRH